MVFQSDETLETSLLIFLMTQVATEIHWKYIL